MTRLRTGAALALCLVTLCLTDAGAAQMLRIGTWKTAQTIQPFFYERFVTDGFQVKVHAFTNPADQKAALLAGSLDMCGTTLAHAVHSASRGQPVVIVASLCNKCSALVVKKDSTVRSIADLRGKKIGYVPGTMHEILLRESLARSGLVPGRDVTLVRIDFFDMGLALAGGGIDAFLSGEPFPALAAVQGYGRILEYPYYGESIGTINAGMIVTRRLIDRRPDLVAAMVNAHAQATRHLTADPESWLLKASEFGTSPEVLRMAAPNMELAWWMDGDFISKTRALGERMQMLGVIDRQPDYDRLFDLSFVERARTEAAP